MEWAKLYDLGKEQFMLSSEIMDKVWDGNSGIKQDWAPGE